MVGASSFPNDTRSSGCLHGSPSADPFNPGLFLLQQAFLFVLLRELCSMLGGALNNAQSGSDQFSRTTTGAEGSKAPLFPSGGAAPAPAGSLRAGDLSRAYDQRIRARAPATSTPATATGPATVVPAQRTPLTGTQARDALREAWINKYGSAPSEQTLATLTAQWALETGRGSSMMNYNFGGIKGTSPSGLTVEYGTREGWGATETRIRARFRAYNTAAEGAEDYLSLLDRRYPNALAAARNGDPDGFVRQLKRGGYFTGNEDAYARSVRNMSQQALTQGFDSIGARSGTALA